MVNKISQPYGHIVHVTDIISLIDNVTSKNDHFFMILSVWVGFRLPEENSKELFETCG
jgi:hypothetical protein